MKGILQPSLSNFWVDLISGFGVKTYPTVCNAIDPNNREKFGVEERISPDIHMMVFATGYIGISFHYYPKEEVLEITQFDSDFINDFPSRGDWRAHVPCTTDMFAELRKKLDNTFHFED